MADRIPEPVRYFLMACACLFILAMTITAIAVILTLVGRGLDWGPSDG